MAYEAKTEPTLQDSTMSYTLESHGDLKEKDYWPLFIKDEFPNYEMFWKKYVVELTNRPVDILFKTDSELAKIGKTKADIYIAELHYSILKHLIRAYQILKELESPSGDVFDQFDLVVEGVTRLCGAQDNCFEILERLMSGNAYVTFDERASRSARLHWQITQKFPLQTVRKYRNYLVHFVMQPQFFDPQGRLFLPQIGTENKYLDWRSIHDPNSNPRSDFISTYLIFKCAWDETLKYINGQWNNL